MLRARGFKNYQRWGAGEHVPAVGTPDAGTAVPGLDGGFATLRAGGLFPSLLTATCYRLSARQPVSWMPEMNFGY